MCWYHGVYVNYSYLKVLTADWNYKIPFVQGHRDKTNIGLTGHCENVWYTAKWHSVWSVSLQIQNWIPFHKSNFRYYILHSLIWTVMFFVDIYRILRFYVGNKNFRYGQLFVDSLSRHAQTVYPQSIVGSSGIVVPIWVGGPPRMELLFGNQILSKSQFIHSATRAWEWITGLSQECRAVCLRNHLIKYKQTFRFSSTDVHSDKFIQSKEISSMFISFTPYFSHMNRGAFDGKQYENQTWECLMPSQFPGIMCLWSRNNIHPR